MEIIITDRINLIIKKMQESINLFKFMLNINIEKFEKLIESNIFDNLQILMDFVSNCGPMEYINLLQSKIEHDKEKLFFVACENNNYDYVNYVIKNININTQNNENKCTGLHIACHKGCGGIVELLLVNGIDYTLKNDHGAYKDTAMHIAAYYNKKHCLELLLNIPNIDINILNNKNESPLFDACKNNSIDCVKLLIDNKADLHIRNIDDQTIFDIAHKNTLSYLNQFIKPLDYDVVRKKLYDLENKFKKLKDIIN
jgi:ankyrin repeat protein